MNKKVLIIDDDQSIRENLEMVLDMEGYPVASCENGLVALQYLLNLKPEDYPGLIILDLRMPVMDGVTFVNTLTEKHPELLSIPTVIASADLEYVKEAQFQTKLEKMKKPFTLDELFKVVQKYCG